jgi:hypothetical protein
MQNARYLPGTQWALSQNADDQTAGSRGK